MSRGGSSLCPWLTQVGPLAHRHATVDQQHDAIGHQHGTIGQYGTICRPAWHNLPPVWRRIRPTKTDGSRLPAPIAYPGYRMLTCRLQPSPTAPLRSRAVRVAARGGRRSGRRGPGRAGCGCTSSGRCPSLHVRRAAPSGRRRRWPWSAGGGRRLGSGLVDVVRRTIVRIGHRLRTLPFPVRRPAGSPA